MESNVQKMKTALKHCIEELSPYCNGGTRRDDVLEEAKQSYALPLRNADVGTAEEQAKRYHATGAVYHTLTLTNALEWEQIPYEEGGEI